MSLPLGSLHRPSSNDVDRSNVVAGVDAEASAPARESALSPAPALSGLRTWLRDVFKLLRSWIVGTPPSRVAMQHATSAALAFPPVDAKLSERAAKVLSPDGPGPALIDNASGVVRSLLVAPNPFVLRVSSEGDRESVGWSDSTMVSADEATVRLHDPKGFSQEKTVTLVPWDNESLRAFADTLRDNPREPFALILGPRKWKGEATQKQEFPDLSCLAEANLSSLTVDGLWLQADDVLSSALKDAKFEINLTDLFADSDAQINDVLTYPTLASLNTSCNLDDAGAAMIAVHPSLRDISVLSMSERAFSKVLENPRLQSLQIDDPISIGQGATALRDHPGLETMQIAVDDPASLIALSTNTNIKKLTLTAGDAAVAALSALSNLAGLKSVSVYGMSGVICGADDLRGLCSLPLDNLDVGELAMDEAARAVVAGAHAKALIIKNEEGGLGRDALDALMTNTYVSSLTIDAEMDEASARRLASHPILEKLEITVPEYDSILGVIRQAWVAAGKQLENLTILHYT